MASNFTEPDQPAAAGLFDRLPEAVRTSLTDEQSQAIADAAQDWRRHAVDLRLTLPWFGRSVFLTLVARRAAERRRHPLLTLGNVAFGATLAIGVYVALIAAALVYSTILDF